MKASKQSLPLILIALALLLSGANPSPRPTEQSNDSADFGNHRAEQAPSPIGLPYNSQAPQQRIAPTNKKSDASDTSNDVIAIAAVISAIAALAIGLFNWQLVGVTRDMVNAADAALHVNRPAIIVTAIELRHVENRVLRGFEPVIYNLGSGPAEIIGFFAHSKVFDAFDGQWLAADEPRAADFIWDAESDRREFTRAFLAPTESTANYVSIVIPVSNWIEADIKAVEDENKRRAVYGLIRYRSSVKEYWTRFFYWWEPGARRFRRANSKELNART